MATSRLTTACFRARMRAPTAMVTDNTVGIATGMAATVNTSANCKVVAKLVAAEHRHGDDQDHQRHGDHDQVIADFQHRLLKMADRMGGLNQFAVFPK